MTIHPNGVATCGTTHHALWCAEEGLQHDPWMIEQLVVNVKPGDLVVNAGAHIGTLAAGLIDAGAEVICFEPNPDAAECLRHNCPKARIIACGLSDEDVEGSLHVVKSNAGMSYISDTNGNTPVVLVTLDSYKLRPAMIVMDIEGMEVAALRGAWETINACHPTLIMEVNDGALRRQGESEVSLLHLVGEELGYSWRILQGYHKLGDPQYDIVAKYEGLR